MIRVNADWWQTLFDEVYLVTDAPFVCNPALTKREVDVVERVLRLRRSDRILGLCGGQGRHALELARRGYLQSAVVDHAVFLLQRGRREALATGLDVHFCQGDARDIPLRSASVDVVLLMGNSFGYFADVADDQRLLAEAARVLRRGGRFLVDCTDDEFLRQHFSPESWHEATDDAVVCWKRELVGDVVRIREMVLSKRAGLWRDHTYAERLYTPARLQALLVDAGFEPAKTSRRALVFDPDNDMDYGLATHRMLITAVKG